MDITDYLALDPPHLSLLRFLFKDESPECIVEIGSCEGEDSLRYLQMFPSARVISVEPLPSNIEKIKKNIGEVYGERFTLVSCAIGEKTGTQPFHVSSGRPENARDDNWDYGNKSSSLLKPSLLMSQFHKWLSFNKTISVDVLTLRSLLDRCNVAKCDFMHLDVQGAELQILSAGRNSLRNIRAVWLEVSDHAIYENQPASHRIQEFMENNGFIKLIDAKSGGFGDHFYIQPRLFDVRLKHRQPSE